jgi:hypothetical protein
MFAAKDTLLTRPSGGAYQISRSVRLRSSASAYLNRTFTTPTNNIKWSWSGWVKRGALSSQSNLFTACDSGAANFFFVGFDSTTNSINFAQTSSGTYNLQGTTAAVFRDPAAWYHVVVVYDSANATSTDRFIIYINGVRQTLTYSVGPFALNTVCQINSARSTILGALFTTSAIQLFDGYMTEINFIDGQALTPSSFGETNAITGVWQPKAYSGTYGTNGFYLNFSDNSTAAALGTDFSGNSNTWTVNNISVTAGVTYDSMLDVPTLYADGGNGRGNYCTWSPLGTQIATYTTSITNGNLSASYNAATNVARINGTLGVSSGKWYFEFQATAGSPMIGFATTDGANAYVYDGNVANKRNYAPITSGSPTSAAYGATWNTTNVIGVALDLDAGTLVFYKDNISQGTAYSSLSGTFTPIFGFQGGTTVTGVGNFGQQPFTYTPPTGFVALNTQNLPTPTISNGASYMAATTYTGTGSALTIANTVGSASFQPDLVWVKGRSGATDHAWYDAVRGVQKQLESNTTTAETTETTGLTAFGSTGFTVGALAQMNTNTATYVAWQWLAGAGSSSSNTSGSITSTVSVNATAGFSVVTYTGTGANATVGHGLGVKPSMVIVKWRSSAGGSWATWHSSFVTASNTDYLLLDSTLAKGGAGSQLFWNTTVPTSSVFSIGTNAGLNTNTGTYVAYCFAAVAGYSAFGSYTGNGSADGPFVYLGFRPRFVMMKASSAARGWIMFDTTRDPYNVSQYRLFANTSDAESSGTTANNIDILSNGFKPRLGVNSEPSNESGTTYIYMAFAENPFKISLAR